MIFDFSSAIGGVSASLPLRALPDLELHAVSDPGAGVLANLLDGFLDADFPAVVAAFSFFAPIFGAARRGFFLPAFDARSLGAPDAARLDDALRSALRLVTGCERLAASFAPCFLSPTACPISLRPGAVFCR